MKFLENFKTSQGKKKLGKESEKIRRNKSLVNLKDAKSIGIVFACIDEQTYLTTRKFSKMLKEEGREVKVFAYIDDKATPTYWLPKVDYDFITKKDLNFYKIPKVDTHSKFTSIDFDILISLNLTPCFPLDYVVRVSKAKFKVGHDEENMDIYDFMINTPDENNLDEYIKQVLHYLNLINS